MQTFLDWTNAWPAAVFKHGQCDAVRDGAPMDLRCKADVHGQTCSERMAGFVRRLETEIPGLPFLSLPFAEDLEKALTGLEPFIRGFKHMLVLGIGGSALGARALQKTFFPAQDQPGHNGPWLWIADNIDPALFHAYLAKLPPEQTLVVVISKSGGTVETMAQYLLVLPWLQAKVGNNWKEHLLLVTDERKGFLREEAERHGFRSLPVPDDLGGRYSALSAVGLVPAVFLGMDWKRLMQGAKDLGRPLAANPSALFEHPAWKLAIWASHLTYAGLNQLIFFCYVPSMAFFGAWFGQLWAESLGKQGKGSMPLPAVGVTDQHSLLQMFLNGPRDKGCLFLSSTADKSLPMPGNLPPQWKWLETHSLGDILEAETLATRMSLAEAGIPLLHIQLPDAGEYSAGKLMLLLEAATVFTGWQLGVNPLDQPAVEEGKLLARARLGAPGSEPDKARLESFLNKTAQLAAF